MDSDDAWRFTTLWMQAHPAVAGVLWAMVRDPHAVDDLLQEVAAAAFRGLESWDPGRSFTAWAVGIARHKAVDWLRRRAAEVPLDDVSLDRLGEACTRCAPELSAREIALHACLEGLAGRSRQALAWHHGEDRPVDEVAHRLRVSVANAKVLLFRARAALRACIDRRIVAERGP